MAAIQRAIRTTPVLSPSHSRIHIFTDNWSIAQALRGGTKKPEFATRSLRKTIQDAISLGIREITIQWIPGHYGIQGNDCADELAKAAVSAESSQEQAILPSLRVLRSMIWDDVWAFWETRWSHGKSARYVPTNLPKPLELKRLHQDLSKSESAMITQFRVGHTSLNWLRARFKKSDTKLCSCGAVETSAHLILDCPKYADLRQDFRNDMMQKCQKIRTSLQWILSHVPIIASTAKFLCAALERRNSRT